MYMNCQVFFFIFRVMGQGFETSANPEILFHGEICKKKIRQLCIFITRLMIVVGYYGFMSDSCVSFKAKSQGLGAIFGLFWT